MDKTLATAKTSNLTIEDMRYKPIKTCEQLKECNKEQSVLEFWNTNTTLISTSTNSSTGTGQQESTSTSTTNQDPNDSIDDFIVAPDYVF